MLLLYNNRGSDVIYIKLNYLYSDVVVTDAAVKRPLMCVHSVVPLFEPGKAPILYF